MFRKTLFALSLAVSAGLAAGAQARDPVVFLSSQLRPLEAAELVRNVILKGFTPGAEFVPEQPAELVTRLKAEQQAGKHTISLVAGVHGELQPMVPEGI